MAAASSPLPGQPGRGSRRARLGSRVTPRARRWPSAPLGPRGDGLRPAAALRRSCRLLRVPAGQQRDGAAQAGRWAPLWPTKPQLLALSVHAAPWLFFWRGKEDARGVYVWLSNVLKTKTRSIANMKAASLWTDKACKLLNSYNFQSAASVCEAHSWQQGQFYPDY